MSGAKNSQTETSKVKGVFWRTASSAPSLKVSCPQRRRLQMPRWLFIAPLRAGEQRGEGVPDGDVEGQGRLLEARVFGAELEGVLPPAQAVADAPVVVHSPLARRRAAGRRSPRRRRRRSRAASGGPRLRRRA